MESDITQKHIIPDFLTSKERDQNKTIDSRYYPRIDSNL